MKILRTTPFSTVEGLTELLMILYMGDAMLASDSVTHLRTLIGIGTWN